MKNLQFITRTGILLAIALAAQLLGHYQFITGPVVNAVLVLAAAYVGIAGGVIIACITPGVAFLVGILPPPLAPMIPVIMTANAVLVLTFAWIKRYNVYLGAVAAAVAKFMVFFIAVNYILVYLNIKLPALLVSAFSFPQLYTALAGGLIAAIIIKKYPFN